MPYSTHEPVARGLTFNADVPDAALDPYGLSFDGTHCRALGLEWIESDRTTRPAARTATLDIPGRDGAYVFPGHAYDQRTISGSLYLVEDLSTEQLQRRIRDIAYWLRRRGRLVFDYEPHLHYDAIAETPVGFSLAWGYGEIPVAFTCQPFARSEVRTVVERLDAPGDRMCASVSGTQPTPPVLTITNVGTEAISGIRIHRKAEV